MVASASAESFSEVAIACAWPERVGRLPDAAVGALGRRDRLRDEVHVLLALCGEALQLLQDALPLGLAGRVLGERRGLVDERHLGGVEGLGDAAVVEEEGALPEAADELAQHAQVGQRHVHLGRLTVELGVVLLDRVREVELHDRVAAAARLHHHVVQHALAVVADGLQQVLARRDLDLGGALRGDLVAPLAVDGDRAGHVGVDQERRAGRSRLAAAGASASAPWERAGWGSGSS
jgi:hypothetical protein